MSTTFPPGASEGDTVVLEGRTWIYEDGKWVLKAAAIDTDFTATVPVTVDKTQDGIIDYGFSIQDLTPLRNT